MKIQINATGKILNLPLGSAIRLMNKGIAHEVKEDVKVIDIKPVASYEEVIIDEPKIKVKRTRKSKLLKDESETAETEW